MAVILYKQGTSRTVNGIKCEFQICNEYSYLHYLDEGWFYSPEECYATEKDQEAPEATVSDDKIRAKAKESSISNWHNKSIERLVRELKELKDAE